MTTERPVDTNQAVVYNNVAVAPNDQILTKVMSAPVIYVREDPKCCFCPQTYKVYIHAEAISDGNFDILKDPLFNVVDDACLLWIILPFIIMLPFQNVVNNVAQKNVAQKNVALVSDMEFL